MTSWITDISQIIVFGLNLHQISFILAPCLFWLITVTIFSRMCKYSSVTSYLGRHHSNDRYNYELIVDNVQIISYDMSFIPGLYLIQKQSYV